MKTGVVVKYISILGIVFSVMGAFLKTGGDGTSLVFVLITTLIVIVASIKK